MRLSALLGLLLMLAGCSGSAGVLVSQMAPTPQREYTPKMTTYALHADGTAGSADVTYTNVSGISQASVSLPLRNKAGDLGIRFTSDDVPAYLSILVQNSGSTGSVNCSIEVDGVVVASNETSADYGIVTCEYAP